MKKFLIFLAVLVVLIAGAIVAVSLLVSPQFIADQLTTQVKAKTGRTLTISGPLRLTYWPNLSVTANKVALSNPPGMFEGRFAAIETLRISVKALPLLSKKVEITELTLTKPVVGLVIDSKGRANWQFDTGAKTAATTTEPRTDPAIESVKLAPIVIRGGDIRYLDERSGAVFAARDMNLTIKVGGLSGPIDLKGDLLWNGERVNASTFIKAPTRLAGEGTPLDLAITAKPVEIQFSGRARLQNGLSLVGTLGFKTPSLRGLAKWAGKPLAPGRGLGPFSIKSGLDLSGKTIKLTKALISLDGMNANGTMTLSLKGARPAVSASLGMDRIDTNIYIAPSKKSATKSSSSDWSDAPIDLSGLRAVDARLAIIVNQIRYQKVTIGKTRLDVTLKGGRLDARLKEMAFYDGRAVGQLVLNGADKTPTLQGALNAQGLNGLRLLTDFADFRRIRGTGAIQLSLTTQGKSQREMVSRLAGNVGLKFTDGALRGINVAAMVRKVQSAILGGWEKQEARDTDFAVLAATFKFKDGIGDNNDLQMLGPFVRVTGKGRVDLLRRSVNYRVEPKLVASTKGQGGIADKTGLPVPIIIKGPWASPKVYPDIEGILDNPKAAFSKLNSLIGKGGKIDLKKAGQKVEDAAKVKAKQILGREVKNKDVDAVKKKGKKLLKGLFGKNKKAPAQ